MQECRRRADGELKFERMIMGGVPRTTGICWDDSARRVSPCRDWAAHKIIFCGYMTARRRRDIRGIRQRCMWIIHYERRKHFQAASSGDDGEVRAIPSIQRERFPD